LFIFLSLKEILYHMVFLNFERVIFSIGLFMSWLKNNLKISPLLDFLNVFFQCRKLMIFQNVFRFLHSKTHAIFISYHVPLVTWFFEGLLLHCSFYVIKIYCTHINLCLYWIHWSCILMYALFWCTSYHYINNT
jgi:hypothetical protein